MKGFRLRYDEVAVKKVSKMMTYIVNTKNDVAIINAAINA